MQFIKQHQQASRTTTYHTIYNQSISC